MSETPVFAGAERYARYGDSDDGTPDATLQAGETGESTDPDVSAQQHEEVRAPEPAGVERGVSSLVGVIVDSPSPPVSLSGTGAQPMSSRSAWKKFLALFGLGGPSKTELAEQAQRLAHAETVIRQQTWTRAVNIAVLCGKGGAGTTPAALTVGGILAHVRGGSTCVFEATSAPGGLAQRAEGTPKRGLSELLASVDLIESAGNLAGYTAPQTSHAAVIGTISHRPQLTPGQLRSIRTVLDRYYQITVTDSDANLRCPVSLTAQRSSDAALIPTTCTALGLTKAVETVQHLTHSAPHLFTTPTPPVVVVLGHSGAPEEKVVTASAREVLEHHLAGHAQVVEAPYEPLFAGSAEFTLAHLLPGTRTVWTEAVATLLARIDDSHTVNYVEGEN